MEEVSLIVDEQETSLRLDQLLVSRFPHHSRNYFQYLIKNDCVLLNGSSIKKREKAKAGDEIEVCFSLTQEISLEPEDIPLDILFEDEHILAINKPVGLVVHPAPGNYSHTFVNALLFHCKNLPYNNENLRPGIVHRLDKDTSGVLLAAKTMEAHHKCIALFSERKIEKRYLAVCVGNPGDGTIRAAIKRHPINRKEMVVCEDGGREALSICKVLAVEKNLSLVEIQLVTGRTHQIRVHLKWKKTPILGDSVYGSSQANKTYQINRQLLHAHSLRFIHPITQQSIEIEAPLAPDMKEIILETHLMHALMSKNCTF